MSDIVITVLAVLAGCLMCFEGYKLFRISLGIAGGIGEGLLIKKGEIIRKMPESELLGALREEILNW